MRHFHTLPRGDEPGVAKSLPSHLCAGEETFVSSGEL